jgi:hypothetical protein
MGKRSPQPANEMSRQNPFLIASPVRARRVRCIAVSALRWCHEEFETGQIQRQALGQASSFGVCIRAGWPR